MKILRCLVTLLHHIFHSKEYITEVVLVSVQVTREFTGSQVLQVDDSIYLSRSIISRGLQYQAFQSIKN